MRAPKPAKNFVSSAKEFKTLVIAASKSHKIRVSDEAIRHLRLTMNTTIASATLLPEAVDVIIAALSKRNKRRVQLEDVHEWLSPSAYADVETSAEEEGDSPKDEPVHYVNKLLNWKREKRVTYYLVDWQPTWEPKSNLNETLVAAFEKERRLLVRKTFFEDEAVEDNSLNDTEN
ncbi:hypothetical protein PHMEG_00035536 [Phytophthora megakarya]|uniref:Chromo domain-containing protein n=1 Tax=Phytophthora megakarya TaxID=4795 RepID=A0A225UNX1_9STRA|nr:hypothetical protein PHMEG_00035536 [Phytophthora megakarya]